MAINKVFNKIKHYCPIKINKIRISMMCSSNRFCNWFIITKIPQLRCLQKEA